MKNIKKLKVILMMIICVLIILVGFVGIYKKSANKYANIIPEYRLSSDLKGATILELEVDDSKKTTYYNKDGKKVDDTQVTDENKKNYTSKEESVNLKENLTEENYKKTLEIFKERLDFLQVDQYSIDLDKNTGKIILTFEDDYSEDVKNILPLEGKLELVDSKTTDAILDYTDVKSAEANYASTDDGYSVYLMLKLTDDGVSKINDIDKYKVSETKKEESKTDEDDEQEEEEITTNKFKVQFDSDEIGEISYDDYVLTGKTLRITLLSNEKSSTTVNSKMNLASVVSKLTTIGKTPVIYKSDVTEYYAKTTVDKNIVRALVIVSIVILVLASIYFIVKYKLSGLFAVITTVANIALFTILIRVTNIAISLNSIAGVVALIIANIYLVSNILKEIGNKEKTFGKNIASAYFKSMDVLIISLIIFAVFAFSKMTVISTIGLLLFWGWLVIALGNLLLTVPMLRIGGKE